MGYLEPILVHPMKCQNSWQIALTHLQHLRLCHTVLVGGLFTASFCCACCSFFIFNSDIIHSIKRKGKAKCRFNLTLAGSPAVKSYLLLSLPLLMLPSLPPIVSPFLAIFVVLPSPPLSLGEPFPRLALPSLVLV